MFRKIQNFIPEPSSEIFYNEDEERYVLVDDSPIRVISSTPIDACNGKLPASIPHFQEFTLTTLLNAGVKLEQLNTVLLRPSVQQFEQSFTDFFTQTSNEFVNHYESDNI
ncbi:hypothetical protein [Capybara microvirus Cap3_SP_416]|nr:hypothetical protein [Capybara microvirus Cap3_SP_416]